MREVPLLEEHVQEALQAAADHAPGGAALASGAHARARTRRRLRVGVGGAALVLASVPLGLALSDGDDPRDVVDPGPSVTRPVVDDVPTGWHVERWRHVLVRVPNTWGEGHLSTWCWRSNVPASPVIERPTRRRPPAVCSGPRLGYGVQFLDTDRLGRPLRDRLSQYQRRGQDARFPAGAWVGVTCGTCEVAVRVVSTDEYAARYLLRTVVSARR